MLEGMNRHKNLARLKTASEPKDIVVIGGGSTGIGIAIDAASRGYRVALVEQSDFGKGTSSRSTKLIHGGVRYLQQRDLSMVRESLQERGLLRQNAPHLVKPLRFVIPCYSRWSAPYYGIGLKLYAWLAGRLSLGPSTILSRKSTLDRLPTLNRSRLRGGVEYFDGQFDDSRLLITMAQTASQQGAILVNYLRAIELVRNESGKTVGVVVQDAESGDEFSIQSQVVINASGPFVDQVSCLDEPKSQPMLAPSQGVHLVFDKSFLPGKTALLVPRTEDGRVMFAIPWHDRVVVGTTETEVEQVALEPKAKEAEIDFILKTAADYFEVPPRREDILSIFTGIRPLAKKAEMTGTAALSRDHSITTSESNLITICGGKWTTYRKMAEDCVDLAAEVGNLKERPCVTRTLRLHGSSDTFGEESELQVYGTDADEVRKLSRSESNEPTTLHSDLPITQGEIIWACRNEMARTVDDVLSRRTRALLLNAKSAEEIAEKVARVMQKELGRNDAWVVEQVTRFSEISGNYRGI